ncbi:MAG: hypothetical protein FWB72_06075 [Firmicutes bacterium]|nr:hypothetical protein [Bacillota bacterium]
MRKFGIGKTVLGRDIVCYRVAGKSERSIIIQASIHAREHITTALAYRLISHYSAHKPLYSLYIVPLVNADGVSLALGGVDFLTCAKLKSYLLGLNNGSHDFSLWKANIRGVDLNTNFNANWGNGQSNRFSASNANFIGHSPNSEPETKALISLTKKVKPVSTLSLHCKGEEIFWFFMQGGANYQRDKQIAKKLAAASGYSLKGGSFSVGGYKDWCIQHLKIPSYTIEIENDNYDYKAPYINLEREFIKNVRLVDALMEHTYEY